MCHGGDDHGDDYGGDDYGGDDYGDYGGDVNGEEACEWQDFGYYECMDVGCCEWHWGMCWSAVGDDMCYENNDGGDYGDDGGDYGDDEVNGEEACEMDDLSFNECIDVGCCEWDDGMCWSAVG